MLCPPRGERSHVQVRHCLPFHIKNRVGVTWVFQGRIRTTDGIVRMVPCVWVIPFSAYFNCYPFFLNNQNWRYPIWDHLCTICSSNRGGGLFPVTALVFGGYIRDSQDTAYYIPISIRKQIYCQLLKLYDYILH